MILRRVIQHVRDQDWIAIAIDFFIVVVGVYMGIELGNWNDEREARLDYQSALQRLGVEIDANLEMLDKLEPAVLQSLRVVEQAIDVLKSCEESEPNRQIVNAGLREIRGTYGFHLRRNSLDELTNDPRLLEQQTAETRKRLTDMSFYFDLIRRDADFVEYHPLRGRFEKNPIIIIGAQVDHVAEYYGVDYSQEWRHLLLGVPIDEACHDNELMKSFFSWEAWQDNLPIFIRTIRKELNATKTILAAG